jgi:PleD family two-component response regulator
MEVVRKTIILVDDIDFHLMSVKDRLKNHYKVYPAKSVEILFEILTRVIPDLIIMDLNMPDVDGYEAVKQLKSDKLYAGIPVIVLSSSKDRERVIKAKNLGAVDYVSKPFSDADLIESIEYQLDPAKQAKYRPVILAVDDDPGILNSVNYILGNRYKVYPLPDPRRIKELLKSITPDLFLLDYNMPGYSGFDLVPVIRGDTDHKDTPIVFLTTERKEDVIATAIQLGAGGFILKPIEASILREKMESLLKSFIMNRRMRRL